MVIMLDSRGLHQRLNETIVAAAKRQIGRGGMYATFVAVYDGEMGMATVIKHRAGMSGDTYECPYDICKDIARDILRGGVIMAMTIRVGGISYNLDHIRKIDHVNEDRDGMAAVIIFWANGDIEVLQGAEAYAFDAQMFIFQMHVDAAIGEEFAREVKLANHEASGKRV